MPRPPTAILALLLAAPLAGAQPDDAAYRAATGLLRRDMPREAAVEYRAFLREHPDHPKAALARYGLAICLTRTERWAEAATELDAIPADGEFEFAPDALLLRARCAQATGDDAAAARALERVLEEYPKFERADAAAAILAESRFRAGDRGASRSIFARFERDWPASALRPRAEYFLALIDAAEGRDDPAAARLASLRAAWPTSDVAAQAALAEAQCRHRLFSAGRAEQAEQAARLYGTAQRSEQESVIPAALLGAAQLERATGHPDQAARTLDDLLARYPRDPVAPAGALERARTHLDQGAPDRALALAQPIAADARSPLASEAALVAAKSEIAMERFGDAARRLQRAADTHPESPIVPELLYDRAVALGRAGRTDEALALFADLRTRAPDHPLASEALASEASLALTSGDPARAAALAGQFLDSHADHPRAAAVSLTLAEAASGSGDADDAQRAYADFLRRYPDDPRAPAVAVQRALALARLGRTDEAVPLLEASLRTTALDPELRHAAGAVLADAAIAREDWPAAERFLKPIAASPKGRSPDALLKLALAIQHQGRAPEALSLYDLITTEHAGEPAATQAAFERAQILVEQGKLEEARAGFERVIADEAEQDKRFTVHAQRHLAAIASRQGRTDEAADLLGRIAASPDGGADALYEQGAALLAAGRYDDADAVLSRFMSAAPHHPRAADAAAQRAIATSRRGDFDQALAILDAADTQSMSPAIRAAAAYERAWALKELGRADDARDAYTRALATPLPAALEAHAALDLAQLHIAAGHHDQALPLLQRAAAAAEKRADQGAPIAERALYLRAVCELSSDHARDAAATLDAFLQRYPRSDLAPAAGLLAGQAYLAAGRADSAVARLRAVIAANPPPQTLRPALLCLGEACAAAQQWDDSRAAFERYLDGASEDDLWFQARFGIGWALENRGRHAEAIGAYRDVVARHDGPTAARAQFQIGECLFAMDQLDEAVRELLKVDILYAYPEWSAAALYEAGRCLAKLGKPDEAAAQFTQVVDRFKDTDWSRLARRQLDQLKPESLPGRAAGTPGAR